MTIKLKTKNEDICLQVDLTKYKTIVFDCDGVILDSNVVKTEAYFRTAKNLGASDAEAQQLVDYHVKLGGISRYHKFDWYVREVLKQPVSDKAIQVLLDEFSRELEEGLMHCTIADGLQALRDATKDAKWMILSGGDQQEIRDLFAKRDLAKHFDGGLFGSPDNKDTVLAREKANGHLQMPALFIGDSKYDHESSTNAGLDFIFVSDWTEVPDWQDYCHKHQLHVLPNLASFIL